MQVELKAIQHEVGITFVFVTHDQHEALAMSDRIAVFSNGRIEQVGTPEQIYEHPATSFVAGFVGTTNVLRDDVAQRLVNRAGTYVLRPERISVGEPSSAPPADHVSVEGTVRDVQYLGAQGRVRVVADLGVELIASVPSDGLAGVAPERRVRLSWPASAVFHVADTELPEGEST